MPAVYIGAAATIGSGIFGAMGQAEENRKNRKAAKKQNKYNKKVWRFNNSEQDRIYDFKVEEQKIAKRNYEADIQFQEDSRQQQWDYKMGIRDYQFSQEMRAYDESVARATRQKSFNQMAEEQSLLDQQRYLQETLQGIGFTEQQTMLDFAYATAGLELKRGQAQAQSQLALGQASARSQLEIGQAEGLSQTQLRQAKGAAELSTQRVKEETALGIKTARSQTQLARQQSRIEALKARGSALAAGQAGRSAAKISQALRAEAGAEQAGLVEQFKLAEESALQKQFFDVMSIDQKLMFTEQNVAQSLMNLRQNSLFQLLTTQQNVVQQLMFTEQGIDLNLDQLNSQLELDKQMISASRENLSAADASARRRIALARQQADLEAEANIRLKPEIAPPLPEPMTLPRKEWGKIFRPGEPPEPNKVQAQVTNPYLTLGQSVVSGIGDLASAGVFDDLFGGGGSGTNFGTASTNFPVFGSGGGLGVSDTSVFNLNFNPMSLTP